MASTNGDIKRCCCLSVKRHACVFTKFKPLPSKKPLANQEPKVRKMQREACHQSSAWLVATCASCLDLTGSTLQKNRNQIIKYCRLSCWNQKIFIGCFCAIVVCVFVYIFTQKLQIEFSHVQLLRRLQAYPKTNEWLENPA